MVVVGALLVRRSGVDGKLLVVVRTGTTAEWRGKCDLPIFACLWSLL